MHPAYILGPNQSVPWINYAFYRIKRFKATWHSTSGSAALGAGLMCYFKDPNTAWSTNLFNCTTNSPYGVIQNTIPSCMFPYAQTTCSLNLDLPNDRTYSIWSSVSNPNSMQDPEIEQTFQGVFMFLNANNHSPASISGWFTYDYDIELFGQRGYLDASAYPGFQIEPNSIPVRNMRVVSAPCSTVSACASAPAETHHSDSESDELECYASAASSRPIETPARTKHVTLAALPKH
jgi:hypothetical protein